MEWVSENSQPNDAALIIYTSGTTGLVFCVVSCLHDDAFAGKPKGVVHTHKSVEYMIRSLVTAWEWKPSDHILHFLPTHHIHGMSLTPKCMHLLLVRLEGKSAHVWHIW
jgi:malonyl-CoA/methylmalonyl-CoA synthetase